MIEPPPERPTHRCVCVIVGQAQVVANDYLSGQCAQTGLSMDQPFCDGCEDRHPVIEDGRLVTTVHEVLMLNEISIR